MNRSRYLDIVDNVVVQQEEEVFAESPDGFIGEITRRLLELKKTGSSLPEGIPKVYANAQQSEVFKLADSLKDEEIIDNALLMVYQYVKEMQS